MLPSDLFPPVETTMASLPEKNEMKLMVLTDLAAVCKKLSDSSAITEDQAGAVPSIRRGIQFAIALLRPRHSEKGFGRPQTAD
jgi:hypothetical protein